MSSPNDKEIELSRKALVWLGQGQLPMLLVLSSAWDTQKCYQNTVYKRREVSDGNFLASINSLSSILSVRIWLTIDIIIDYFIDTTRISFYADWTVWLVRRFELVCSFCSEDQAGHVDSYINIFTCWGRQKKLEIAIIAINWVLCFVLFFGWYNIKLHASIMSLGIECTLILTAPKDNAPIYVWYNRIDEILSPITLMMFKQCLIYYLFCICVVCAMSSTATGFTQDDIIETLHYEHGQALERTNGYLCDSPVDGGAYVMWWISQAKDHYGSRLSMLGPDAKENEVNQEALIKKCLLYNVDSKTLIRNIDLKRSFRNTNLDTLILCFDLEILMWTR